MGLLLGLGMAWLFVPVAARAEPRVALVVGNGSYQQVHPLDNPMLDGSCWPRHSPRSAST